jgi:arginase family enzyme
MPVELIVVPYVLGREGVGMGAGPLALAAAAAEALEAKRVRRVALSAPFSNEIGACFDLNRQVARAVAGARERGALPVVMTGNCHTQQAVVAGLGIHELTLVWLDCHADFHTPETTRSGFFDGSALSMTIGDCWTALCATVAGFEPLPADRVVLVGARDGARGRRRLDARRRHRLGLRPGVRRRRWCPGRGTRRAAARRASCPQASCPGSIRFARWKLNSSASVPRSARTGSSRIAS